MIGQIIPLVGDDVVGDITNQLVEACGTLIRLSTAWVFESAWRPEFGKDWFLDIYGKSMTVGLMLMIPLIVLAIIQGTLSAKPGIGIRTLIVDIGFAIFGMFFITKVLQSAIYLTDEISLWMLQDNDEYTKAFLDYVSQSTAKWTNYLGFFVALIMFFVVGLASVMLMTVMFGRAILLTMMGVFLPLAFAMMVWPPMRRGLRVMIDFVLGIIMAKIGIALALMIGAAALGSMVGFQPPPAGTPDFAVTAGGTVLYQNSYTVQRLDGQPLQFNPNPGFLNINAVVTNTVLAVLNSDSTTVRGNSIQMITDPSTGKYATKFVLGQKVDPAAEKYYLVINPVSSDRAQLNISSAAPESIRKNFQHA